MVKEARLNVVKFALAAAIVWAAMFFLITILEIFNILGGFPGLTNLMLGIYGGFGYSLTPLGAFLGTVYAFIDSFIIVFIFAGLYNKLLDRKKLF
jgi:uncharacterized membrane protein